MAGVQQGVPMGETVKAGPQIHKMTDCTGIITQQKFDINELICPGCVANTYKIKGDQGWDSMEMGTDFEDAAGWDQKKKMFVAQEKSTMMQKVCCGRFREFDMKLWVKKKKSGLQQYQFFRPFKCSIICCCFLFNPQEIQANDASGNNLGKVVHEWNCIGEMCGKRLFRVEDNSATPKYYIERNICCNKNMCAPSCLCPVHNMQILDANKQPTDGYLNGLFPGCNIKSLIGGSLRSTYHLKFPTAASEEDRAVLMAGMFLIEYVHFESQDRDDGIAA